MILPTEQFLRDIFIHQGEVLDVSVKDYVNNQDLNMQEGFAFVTFIKEEAAARATATYNSVTIEGILLSCTLSYRNPKQPNRNNLYAAMKKTSPL